MEQIIFLTKIEEDGTIHFTDVMHLLSPEVAG